MELEHSFTVPAGVDETWATFMDLEQVGSCFPGATVTEASDEAFAGTVKVKLGPIALVYGGTGKFVERDDAAHRAVIEAKGKDKRGNGTAGATVRIALAPAGTGTQVDVTTDLQVTGKPAQFGRGVMQDVSDKLLQQFVGCIEGRLGESSTAPADAVPDGPEAPTETAASDDAAVPVVGSPAPAAAAATAPVPAPVPAAPSPTRRPVPRPVEQDDSIDLGATVLPVLLRTYGGYVAAGLAGVVIGWLIGRGGS